MDIEIFLKFLFLTWFVHVGICISKGIEKEVDGPHNLFLPREMLNEVSILSRLEEVSIEVDGIFFRVEGSKRVDISICDFRISVKAGAQECPMPILLVIILRLFVYMLPFFSVHRFSIRPRGTLRSDKYLINAL